MQALLAQMGVTDRRAQRRVRDARRGDASTGRSRPTSWSRRCARRSWRWGRSSRAAGEARVSLPGGCAIGLRPVDQHVKGLQAMGAEIDLDARLHQRARDAPDGHALRLRRRDGDRHREPDDGGRARRRRDDARERRARARDRRPRRTASSRWARASRAPAPIASSSKASRSLHGATHAIMPDRIETGTFVAAAAATGGDVVDRRRRSRARSTPCSTSCARRARTSRPASRRSACRGDGQLRAASVRTAPYPGFPTDMQAQFMALATRRRRRVGDHRDDLREPDDARAGAACASAPTSRSRATRRRQGRRAR